MQMVGPRPHFSFFRKRAHEHRTPDSYNTQVGAPTLWPLMRDPHSDAAPIPQREHVSCSEGLLRLPAGSLAGAALVAPPVVMLVHFEAAMEEPDMVEVRPYLRHVPPHELVELLRQGHRAVFARFAPHVHCNFPLATMCAQETFQRVDLLAEMGSLGHELALHGVRPSIVAVVGAVFEALRVNDERGHSDALIAPPKLEPAAVAVHAHEGDDARTPGTSVGAPTLISRAPGLGLHSLRLNLCRLWEPSLCGCLFLWFSSPNIACT